MKMDAFKFGGSLYDYGPESVQLAPESLPAEKTRGNNLPVAYVVRENDLAPFRELGEGFVDRGRKDKRKELSAYLLRCKGIPFIVGGHTEAGQLIRSVRTLLLRAEGHDGNIYVIGAGAVVFEEMKRRVQTAAPKRMKGTQASATPVGESSAEGRTLVMSLLYKHEVPEALCRDFVGQSEDAQFLRHLIMRAASQNVPVLLLGETGSGKEVIATSIHRCGNRSQGPFVPVNCGAIPSELFESELFGYKKGTHSEARYDKNGLWRQANGGTLFLDEIADLAANHQVKILRALDDGVIWPVGAVKGEQVDARIIAATNRDLSSMVAAGQFREDLYYRLRAFMIHTIPLREHPEDIPLLASHMWKKIAGDAAALPDAIVTELQAYRWPGNVRDIKLTLACLFSYFGRDNLRIEHLRAVMRLQGQGDTRASGPLSAWEFDQHQVECLRHLKKAGDAVRATQVALLPVVVKKADGVSIQAGLPVFSNFIEELDRLCLHPLLFHSEPVFDVICRLKGKLSYFVSLLPNHRRDAMKFWKTELSGQFEQANAALFAEVETLGGRRRIRRPRS
ncbi:MAG: sigma 54-interacting transcriptional regulator [bacterium]